MSKDNYLVGAISALTRLLNIATAAPCAETFSYLDPVFPHIAEVRGSTVVSHCQVRDVAATIWLAVRNARHIQEARSMNFHMKKDGNSIGIGSILCRVPQHVGLNDSRSIQSEDKSEDKSEVETQQWKSTLNRTIAASSISGKSELNGELHFRADFIKHGALLEQYATYEAIAYSMVFLAYLDQHLTMLPGLKLIERGISINFQASVPPMGIPGLLPIEARQALGFLATYFYALQEFRAVRVRVLRTATGAGQEVVLFVGDVVVDIHPEPPRTARESSSTVDLNASTVHLVEATTTAFTYSV